MRDINCRYLECKKADASEIIEIGDIIMIDPDTSSIQRAYIDGLQDIIPNSRLIIGVCVESNNTAPLLQLINGGPSNELDRELLESTSETDITTTVKIVGSDSQQSPRETIKVAYTGTYPVNICGYVDIGDKLGISEHKGKARSLEYSDYGFFKSRSIGKVVQYLNSKTQVKVLLDIE